MDIFFYNSLSGKVDKFTPISQNHVSMYTCGPTVYDTPHIGNARPLVVFDVMYRLLRKIYPSVSYVRNITDVDDKINNKALELNISIRSLTNEVIDKFHRYTTLLNILPVTHEPRATDHIKEMIDIIQILIDNGYAYCTQGHVLYRVRENNQYGILSKRSLDDMIAGSRVEIAPYKEDPLDFVLWKPAAEGQPAWDSPFGRGRPGWHIECSAMSHRYLGVTFDIHAGGQDLQFPHHENEIAQNYGAFGCKMANYWVHNGMLLVDGQKMSKSVGNVIRLDDILSDTNAEIVRYALLSTHYPKTLNWTDDLVRESKASLDRLYSALDGDIASAQETSLEDSTVANALAQNLNTPLALRALHSISGEMFKTDDAVEKARLRAKLLSEAKLLGLLYQTPKNWFSSGQSPDDIAVIEDLIAQRQSAKVAKDYTRADAIRTQLLSMGIVAEDGKDGRTTWKRA